MKSEIKLLKWLTLSSTGLYLFIKLVTMFMKPTDIYLLNNHRLDHLCLRIIICLIGLTYHAYLRTQKGSTSNKIFPNHYKLIIGTILGQCMMTFVLLLISSIQENLWHVTHPSVLDFTSKIDFIYRGIIQITCLAAILEEVLFRGIFEKLLSTITPIRLWITLISALTFTLMHANMSNNLLYFLMGCFLSHLYHQTNYIIYPIIAHGLHNLCATFMVYSSLEGKLVFAINSLTIPTRISLTIALLLAVYRFVNYMIQQPKTKNII